MKVPKRPFYTEKITLDADYPDSLDWSVQRPECVNIIRDQGLCGSCWAFSAVGTMSDTRCIKGADQERV